MRLHTLVPLTVALLVGCASGAGTSDGIDASSTTSAATTTAAGTTTTTDTTSASLFADRPYKVFVPTKYDEKTAAPLVILLHGYTATGDLQEVYFKLQPEAEARGFLYVHPDGLVDRRNNPFWNATDACCDATRSVDDSGYLTFLIDEVSTTYNVDPARIYLVGHSNGGFMSYRMACDHADRIAAIVSLAGSTFLDDSKCKPTEPVSILQIHGTDDQTIRYDGGGAFAQYPSAEAAVGMWAVHNGCSSEMRDSGAIDINFSLDGDETTKSAFTGCRIDGEVELWTMVGGSHVPALQPTFATDIIDWLFEHPKI